MLVTVGKVKKYRQLAHDTSGSDHQRASCRDNATRTKLLSSLSTELVRACRVPLTAALTDDASDVPAAIGVTAVEARRDGVAAPPAADDGVMAELEGEIAVEMDGEKCTCPTVRVMVPGAVAVTMVAAAGVIGGGSAILVIAWCSSIGTSKPTPVPLPRIISELRRLDNRSRDRVGTLVGVMLLLLLSPASTSIAMSVGVTGAGMSAISTATISRPLAAVGVTARSRSEPSGRQSEVGDGSGDDDGTDTFTERDDGTTTVRAEAGSDGRGGDGGGDSSFEEEEDEVGLRCFCCCNASRHLLVGGSKGDGVVGVCALLSLPSGVTHRLLLVLLHVLLLPPCRSRNRSWSLPAPAVAGGVDVSEHGTGVTGAELLSQYTGFTVISRLPRRELDAELVPLLKEPRFSGSCGLMESAAADVSSVMRRILPVRMLLPSGVAGEPFERELCEPPPPPTT